jgi:hypothetical protein
MKKENFFNRHLQETGEGFFEHFLFAFATSLWLSAIAAVLLIHSIFPFLFTITASSQVKKLNEVMQKRANSLTARRDKNNQM